MTDRPREATAPHTRLLKCALEIEDSRAYWAHARGATRATAQQAFDQYWFGARSLARIETLLLNMRSRYDAYPAALDVLCGWPQMSPETRRMICHWHLQLADPVYRNFTGRFLVDRRAGPRPEITRDVVVGWVGQQGSGQWSMSTRIQFASKLLSSAYAAGFVASKHDPRPLTVARVPDDALEYCVYLLREVDFAGTLLDNPYLRSCGLAGPHLEDRLRGLSEIRFKKQSNLVDFGWKHGSLHGWAVAREQHTPDLRLNEATG